MKERLVTIETAKLAKELGFKWKTTYAYNVDGSVHHRDYIPHDFNSRGLLSAPTQEQLGEWLYLEHNLHIALDFIDSVLGFETVVTNVKTNTELVVNIFSFYRVVAMEKGLFESLKLIKDENREK